jgi:hypothetical protein
VLARLQRRTGLTMLGVVLTALCLWPSPARAANDATTTTAKCATPEILNGIRATGATVTTPGAKARTLDKDQATAFMQSWLGYSVFANPPQEHPPTGLPVSQLDVGTLEGTTSSSLVIFYASDGTNAWVGAPAPRPAPPPNDQRWIRAPRPEQTIAAFAGKMAPICTPPPTASSTTAATTVTTIGQAKTDGASGSDTPWALIIIGIAVVVGGGALFAIRSRRRRPA